MKGVLWEILNQVQDDGEGGAFVVMGAVMGGQ
jgi:hypothetical protein